MSGRNFLPISQGDTNLGVYICTSKKALSHTFNTCALFIYVTLLFLRGEKDAFSPEVTCISVGI